MGPFNNDGKIIEIMDKLLGGKYEQQEEYSYTREANLKDQPVELKSVPFKCASSRKTILRKPQPAYSM